jgi:hypothetical protein
METVRMLSNRTAFPPPQYRKLSEKSNKLTRYMKNKIFNLFLLWFLVCATGCRPKRILSKILPNNPTGYIFKIKAVDARFVLAKNLHKYSSLKFHVLEDIYRSSFEKVRLWPTAAKKALFVEANKDNVWMRVSVDSSDVYFNNKNKPLEYEMECLVHFTAINETTTKMEIKVLTSKVHLRDRLLPSPPHFVNNPVYKNVTPTTIEEYKILQCMGKELGVIDQMPPLRL